MGYSHPMGNGGSKRASGDRGQSAAVPITIGFRSSGNKSSSMASRTPRRTAATSAAGEASERADVGVSSAGA